MESMWTTSPSSRTPWSTALLSVTTVEAPLNPWRVDARIESAWVALPSAAVWWTAAAAAGPARVGGAPRPEAPPAAPAGACRGAAEAEAAAGGAVGPLLRAGGGAGR